MVESMQTAATDTEVGVAGAVEQGEPTQINDSSSATTVVSADQSQQGIKDAKATVQESTLSVGDGQEVDHAQVDTVAGESEEHSQTNGDTLEVAANDVKPPTPPLKTSGDEDAAKEDSKSTGLRPETVQHRQDDNGDKPSAYVPAKPVTYMHMKALALQMPNSSNFAQQSSSHNIDPPVLILEARTNLSSARRSFYPRVTRSLPELQLWIFALTLSFPAAIFSPFTYPPTTLATGGAMEDAALRSYLATVTKQLIRVLSKPYVLSHPATVALVDCDFGYNPGMPHVGPGSSVSVRRKLDEGMALARSGHDPLRGKRGKAGAGQTPTSSWDVDGVAAALGLPALPSQASGDTYVASVPSASKGPLSIFSRANASPQRIQPQPSVPIPPGEEDQDEEELTAARNEITRLELQFEKASLAAHTLVERNGAMTATLHQLAAALTDLAKLDEGRTVARKKREAEDVAALNKGIEAWTSAQVGANAALMSTMVPSMSYQSRNARSAIDALLRRAAAATHRHSALVVLVQKRREAERLKRARGEIRQEDVDWVLQELRDAQRTTHVLTHHLSTFTATLKEELKDHSRNTHTDIQESLLQHAKNSIRAQKFMLNNVVRAKDALVALREGKVHVGQASTEQTAEEGSQSLDEGVRNDADATPPAHASKGETQATPEEKLENEIGVKPAGDVATKSEVLPKDTAEGDEISSARVQSSDETHSSGPSLSVPSAGEQLLARTDEPLLTPEPSPWVAKAPWSQDETPSLAEASSSWATPAQSLPQPAIEPSPWDEGEDRDPVKPAFNATSQSTYLPPRDDDPFQDANQSHATPGFGSNVAATSSMSQSAFLPGRDMSRYANPFARIDGGVSANGFHPNPAVGNRAGNVQGQAGGPFATAASDASTQSHAPSQQSARPSKDPWANRSRISASDAARSLAGRF